MLNPIKYINFIYFFLLFKYGYQKILNYIYGCSKIGVASYGLWAKSGPPPAFVSKVLLQHCHTHLFPYFYALPGYNDKAE